MSPEVCICPDGFSGKRCERGKDGASNQCMLCVCFFWLKCMCMETRKTKFDSTRYINQFLKDFIKIDGFKVQSLKWHTCKRCIDVRYFALNLHVKQP